MVAVRGRYHQKRITLQGSHSQRLSRLWERSEGLWTQQYHVWSSNLITDCEKRERVKEVINRKRKASQDTRLNQIEAGTKERNHWR